MKRILGMIGNILVYLLTYIMMQIIVIFGIIFVIAIKSQASGNTGLVSPENIQKIMNENSSVMLILSASITMLIFILIFALDKKNLFEYCNFNGTKNKNLSLAILLGIGFSFFVDGILSMIPVDKLFPTHNKVMEFIVSGSNFPLTVLAVVIIVPFFEEVLFRGLVFRRLKENMNLNLAIIIQALLFGIYHGNLLQGIYASVLGVILALVYTWTESIFANILVHIFFNGTSLLMGKLQLKINLFIVIMIGFIIVIFSLRNLYKGRTRSAQ